ncbi:ATP-binding protein [Clostridiaceae bacterium M8S5]|nr:ATP-binding protein [Clostridiaceae bacterium M8S5]
MDSFEYFCCVIESLMIITIYNTVFYNYLLKPLILLKTLIFTAVCSVVIYFVTFAVPFGLHSFVAVSFAILLVYILDRHNSFLSVFKLTLLIFTSFICLEILCIIAIKPFKDIHIDNIFGLVILFSKFLVLLFVRKYKEKLKLADFIKNLSLVDTYILSCLFILEILFIIINRFMTQYDSYLILYEILLLTLFLGFVLIICFNFKKIVRLEKINHKYVVQQEHIHNLESLVSIVRKEKHDFANHLNTINAICILNKPNSVDRIKTYLSKIGSNIKVDYQMCDSGNDYLDGLLAVKSNLAYEHRIKFDMWFEMPLDLLDIEDSDLISIVSNIVDNGLEALITNDNIHKKKVMTISTYVDNDIYHISVSNNGPQIEDYAMKNMFNRGFSTKAYKKNDRGYGLYIVKTLIERYDGTLRVTSNEDETQFLIKFKIEEEKVGQVRSHVNKEN